MVRALPLVRAGVPRARWVVVGDGPFRPALESAIRAYGLEGAVDLLRPRRRRRARRLAGSRHVFAMPSRVPAGGVGGEGFGIAYLEAAAHGCRRSPATSPAPATRWSTARPALLVDPADHLAVADARRRAAGRRRPRRGDGRGRPAQRRAARLAADGRAGRRAASRGRRAQGTA